MTITNVHYRLVWHDEFNGPVGTQPDVHRWHIVVGGAKSGKELEYYSSSPVNVSLNGRGDLAVTARRQSHASSHHTWHYTSGRLETLDRFHLQYGKIEARIKFPAGVGLWPAFWMLGTDYPRVGWPASGELDMMEFQGQNPFQLVATAHGPAGHRASGWQINKYAHSSSPFSDRFHVYGMVWSRNQIVFTLDGIAYGIVARRDLRPGDRWVFNRPFYVLVNLAVGGFWVGPPTRWTHFPATMLVDWVRVSRAVPKRLGRR